MIAGEQLLEIAAELQREQAGGDEVIDAWLRKRELEKEGVHTFGVAMFAVIRELARDRGLERAAVAVLVYALQVGIVVGEGGEKGLLEAKASAEQVAELLVERQAVLDCINLYGDEVLHKALDSAGLLMGGRQQKGGVDGKAD